MTLGQGSSFCESCLCVTDMCICAFLKEIVGICPTSITCPSLHPEKSYTVFIVQCVVMETNKKGK